MRFKKNNQEPQQRVDRLEIKVIYDDIDYDRQKFVGRSQTQAPDIDNVTLFESDEEVRIGEFYDVEITGSDGIDLVGKVIK